MNSYLFGRALGTVNPQALQRAYCIELLQAIQPAPSIRFDGKDGQNQGDNLNRDTVWAHKAGVNCITVDKFEGRYLLSGGAESSISLWDLESVNNRSKDEVYHPVGSVGKSKSTHQFGITHISFYPFDSLAFLSSSYDHSLKIYDSQTLSPSASFDLHSMVYSHALSPIADHLLVACATQHPAVRLVDLRTGASAHSLSGHQGAVFSVAWSPKHDHILASGGSDGTVRLWDIRRSAGCLGVLDMEDSVGVLGDDGFGTNARPPGRGKAHIGACNGVLWKEDGSHLITAGHDEQVRVWHSGSGANALSHFGPIIKNTNFSTLLPVLAPNYAASPGSHIMFYPNEREVLMFDLFEGTLLKRLRAPGVAFSQAPGRAGQRNVRNRVTSLAWRAGDIELYSAHSDGVMRAWKHRTAEEVETDKDEAEGRVEEDGSRKRKRQALDDVFRDLTKQKITFT